MLRARLLTVFWTGLLFVAPWSAAATTVWTLQAGSSFYDASAEETQSLTGTITTELVDIGSNWRHLITDIAITGSTVSFVEASFGGGAIDIVKPDGPVGQVQIIIGNPDSSRFNLGATTSAGSFTGPADAPTSITLVDLQPFMFGDNDLESGDRLTLVLAPEPSVALLMPLGLALLAWRRRSLWS